MRDKRAITKKYHCLLSDEEGYTTCGLSSLNESNLSLIVLFLDSVLRYLKDNPKANPFYLTSVDEVEGVLELKGSGADDYIDSLMMLIVKASSVVI
jgi:hypothetical protein